MLEDAEPLGENIPTSVHEGQQQPFIEQPPYLGIHGEKWWIKMAVKCFQLVVPYAPQHEA